MDLTFELFCEFLELEEDYVKRLFDHFDLWGCYAITKFDLNWKKKEDLKEPYFATTDTGSQGYWDEISIRGRNSEYIGSLAELMDKFDNLT